MAFVRILFEQDKGEEAFFLRQWGNGTMGYTFGNTEDFSVIECPNGIMIM